MTRPAPDSPDVLRPGTRSAGYAPVILAGALALRIVLAVMAFLRCPPAIQIQGHSEMLGIARSLVAGHGFASPFFVNSGPTAFIPPGYPILLAAIFQVFGLNGAALLIVAALQLLCSILTVWLTMRLARRHFGVWTANVAGCLCGFSLALAVEPFWVWETCLSSLLFLGLLAALPDLRTKAHWAAGGAVTAIATLMNSALFPALFIAGVWQAWRRRAIPWVGVLAFLLIYTPWPARNLAVMHAFIPFRSNFAYELWMGNHPGADGRFHHDLDPEENPQERARFVALGELQYMKTKKEAAHDYIRTHPREFLSLTVRRVVEFWTTSSEGEWWLGAGFSALAFAGLVLLWRSHPGLRVYAVPLTVYPLPYYLTHADPRFRHMIDPLLALLAAHAIVVLARAATARAKAGQRQADPVLEAVARG